MPRSWRPLAAGPLGYPAVDARGLPMTNRSRGGRGRQGPRSRGEAAARSEGGPAGGRPAQALMTKRQRHIWKWKRRQDGVGMTTSVRQHVL
eukprot:6669644-Pyramimonas_sp.AAC.1